MKKIITAGAITLGILGVFGYTSHATTNKISNQTNNTTTQTQQYCNLGHYNCNLIHDNSQHHNNNHINKSHHTW